MKWATLQDIPGVQNFELKKYMKPDSGASKHGGVEEF